MEERVRAAGPAEVAVPEPGVALREPEPVGEAAPAGQAGKTVRAGGPVAGAVRVQAEVAVREVGWGLGSRAPQNPGPSATCPGPTAFRRFAGTAANHPGTE